MRNLILTCILMFMALNVYGEGSLKIESKLVLMPLKNMSTVLDIEEDIEAILLETLIYDGKLDVLQYEQKNGHQARYYMYVDLISYDAYKPRSFIFKFKVKDQEENLVLMDEVLSVEMANASDKSRYAHSTRTTNELLKSIFKDYVQMKFLPKRKTLIEKLKQWLLKSKSRQL